MKNKCLKLFCLILIFIIFIPGCSGSDSKPSNKFVENRINTIVLITIDTWRRDITGFSGKMDPSPTPFLDSLAIKGKIFDNAVTPVPYTAPSHWSMLSGRWPWRDGVMLNGDLPKKDHPEILPVILKKNGFKTAAFVSCRVLAKRAGFSEGFDYYDDFINKSGALHVTKMSERTGDKTVENFSKWYRTSVNRNSKLFLWVHLFDPHAPYIPRASGIKGERDKYISEVAFADFQVQKIYNELNQSGRSDDRSLWIVLSDHGEGLGEHGEDTHGILLHGATTNIPFFLYGNNIKPERIGGLISTVDIFPTVLGKLGIKVERRDGVDLSTETIPEERSIPLESVMGARGYGISTAVGLRKENWLWEHSPEDYLWDILSDPDELQNIAFKHKNLLLKLFDERKKFSSDKEKPGERRNKKMERELRSLGYITGRQKGGKESVRKYIQTGGKWLIEASKSESVKNFQNAETYYTKFLSKYPNSPGVWNKAGMVAVNMGHFEKAEKRFLKSLELDESINSLTNLANILFYKNKFKEAEKYYLKALEIDKEDMFALYNSGLIKEKLEGIKAAAIYYRKYLELYPYHKNASMIRRKLSLNNLL